MSHGWSDEEIRLQRKLTEARERIQQLEVQLAGCGVAATGWASGEQQAIEGEYGWSKSYAAVVELRAKWYTLKIENEKLRATSPAKTDGGEVCGACVIHLIAREGSFFPCVLSNGHDGAHKSGGICVKHGAYVSEKPVPECPRWPECVSGMQLTPLAPPARIPSPGFDEVTDSARPEIRASGKVDVERLRERVEQAICGGYVNTQHMSSPSQRCEAIAARVMTVLESAIAGSTK
jgi:hypothetical protein